MEERRGCQQFEESNMSTASTLSPIDNERLVFSPGSGMC